MKLNSKIKSVTNRLLNEMYEHQVESVTTGLISEMVKTSFSEVLTEENKSKEKRGKQKRGKQKPKNKESRATSNKRKEIMRLLHDNDKDKFDHAELAYRLWDDMDKDTARSYFSKCVRGERQFNSKDVDKLHTMLTDKKS